MSNPFSNTQQVNAVIRIRRGTDAERLNSNTKLDVGELIYTTDKKRLFVGDGTSDNSVDGGILVGNKIWVTDNFLNLGEIQKYDLVYRTDPDFTGFYILTGSNKSDVNNYILVSGPKYFKQINSYVLETATPNKLGGVKVKEGLDITSDGQLSVMIDPETMELVNNKIKVKNPYKGESVLDNFTNTNFASYVGAGIVELSKTSGLTIDNNGVLGLNLDNNTIKLSSTVDGSILYVDSSKIRFAEMPIATEGILGGVKIGDGLSAADDGKLSLNFATDSEFGGLILGEGLSANNNTGKVDVIKTVPFASTTEAGIVKLSEGSVLSADVDGLLDLNIDNNSIKIDTIDGISKLYVDFSTMGTTGAGGGTVVVDPGTIEEDNTVVDEGGGGTGGGATTTTNVTNLVINTVPEKSYIKRLGNCTNSRGSYSAITNDNRVVAWGNLWRYMFGGASDPTISASENVRVPFWKNYDGYNNPSQYKPYGGDFLDDASDDKREYIISDLQWSKYAATALISAVGEVGCDIWVAGTNTSVTSAVVADPLSLVKTKYNNFLVVNSNFTSPNVPCITLFNKDKDFCNITKTNLTKPRDIIEDKTNSVELSTQAFYYVSDNNTIKRINHGGEIISTLSLNTPHALVAPNGLAMSINDNNDNYLYICDVGTNQNKVKIKKLTGDLSVSVIGNSAAGFTDGNAVSAKFTELKRIAIDPTNNNILYVTDSNRLRRLWRTVNNGSTTWNVTTLSLSSNPATSIDGTLTYGGSGTNVATFNNPYGIKVSSDGKRIYVVEAGAKKIRLIDVYTNTVDSFSATTSSYVDTQIKTTAIFDKPRGITKDDIGNLYIADYNNNRIRKINYDPINNTYGDVVTYAGSGKAESKDGVGIAASFNHPNDIVYCGALSALFVVDNASHVIRRINTTTAYVSTIAGRIGIGSTTDGVGIKSRFYYPQCIEYGFKDNKHYLWVSQGKSNYSGIRQIKIDVIGNTQTYTVSSLTNINYSTTYSGDGGLASLARTKYPTGLKYYNNELYFCDTGNNRIRKIKFSDNTIRLVAGNGSANSINGNGLTASFKTPMGLTIKNDVLYVTEYDANRVRKISNFTSDTTANINCSYFVGTGSRGYKNTIGINSLFYAPTRMIEDKNGDFVLTEEYGQYIRRISKDDPYTVTTINGNGKAGYADTTLTTLNWTPFGLDIDGDLGNEKVYFTETTNELIGEISNNRASFYSKLTQGVLGIGPGTNKPTCGFIKLQPYDNAVGATPKFKRVQMISDSDTSSVLFAALDTDDSLWVWGNSPDGAFGTGQYNTIAPTKIYPFEKNILDFGYTASIVEGAVNYSLLSIITKDNKMYTAGDNTTGQLGINVPVSTLANSSVFKICKKDVDGNIIDVNDAKKIVSSYISGKRNNLYISTSGDVYACGDHSKGVLGSGVGAVQNSFKKIDGLTNIKSVMVGGNKDYPTAFALKTDGSLYSWGYNGASKGICLVNNLTDVTINNPTQCYNFEIKDVVTNARFIYSNDNTTKDTAQFGYIDDKYNFYLGGYSTEADIPDFNDNIPYFRKYNMKGITTDVNLNNAEAVIHRSNGTVYRVDRYGPKKLF